jgi:DNA-binding cell septation regulator SpoVG
MAKRRAKMISVLNFKSFSRSSIKGFFDLRYHGLTIKGCRLMSGNNGLWFSFPQLKTEEDGETKYYDQMYLTSLEREHVRKLIITQLLAEGHINEPQPESVKQSRRPQQNSKPRTSSQRTFENEDLSEHYTPADDNSDIPF